MYIKTVSIDIRGMMYSKVLKKITKSTKKCYKRNKKQTNKKNPKGMPMVLNRTTVTRQLACLKKIYLKK